MSVLIVVVHSFFLTPNFDEGLNAYFITNTIDFEKPFFLELEGRIYPVLKIPVLILALCFTYLFPFSFVLPAALYGILCLLCSYLSYKIARFYSNSRTALLSSQLFLYSLLVHNWFCPTRFEIWLLSVIMIVIYLFELYKRHRHTKYLILISIFIGILGLPIHTNASILYVYLLVYIVFNREIFSKKIIRIFLSFGALTTMVGIAIVFFPDPKEALGFFTDYTTHGGNRLVPSIFNLKRFLFFFIWAPYKYLIGFFTLFTGVWIIENWKEFFPTISSIIRRYKNIFIYFGSAVFAIEILPTADWSVYMVYYFFPISFIASKIFFFKISNKGRYIILAFSILAFIRFLAIHISLSDVLDHSNVIKLVIFYLPIIALVLFINKIRLILLYGVLFLGLSLNIFYQYHDWLVYNEVSKVYESNPDQPIIAVPNFNWIDRSSTKYGFAPFFRTSNPHELNNGLIIMGQAESSRAYPVARFLELCPDCDFQLVGKISSSMSLFVRTRYKGLNVYRYSGYNGQLLAKSK